MLIFNHKPKYMISKNYTSFFKELAQNNHKEWFHANKKRYEQDVKAPFLDLLEAILPTLRSWDNRILEDPKKALFRINRDVRFSRDKSPYNLIMKAGFSPYGKKSVFPGYYLGIDAESVHVGGGLFMIQPPELKKLRTHIASDLSSFLEIVDSGKFRSRFGNLKGEKAKRLDKELLPAAEQSDLLFNKQFYAMTEVPLESHYDSGDLPEEITAFFEEIRPLNTFMNEALL